MPDDRDWDEHRRSGDRQSGDGLLPTHGGYRRLRSFQVAELVYDATVSFCARFVDRRSRTHDQMVQAARSGRQNIAEGSMASATSKKSELKLTNVARASLEELLLDYEDFLRHRRLVLWEKDSEAAREVRQRGDLRDLETESAEVVANTVICLIHQATYLLRRQIQRLERDFLDHGGVTERLYNQRIAQRVAVDDAPPCPRCGRPMARRTARQGPSAGREFWGCTGYPECRGSRECDSLT